MADLRIRVDLHPLPRGPPDLNQVLECLRLELGAQPEAASLPQPQQQENLKEIRVLAVVQSHQVARAARRAPLGTTVLIGQPWAAKRTS